MAYSEQKIKDSFEYIISQIESGRALISVLKDSGMPSSKTFYQWLEDDEDKVKYYACACEKRADAIFEDILSIVDDKSKDAAKGTEGMNSVQRARLQMDARKWIASKLNPKKYGDKTDITSGGDKIQTMPTTIQIEITKPDED